MPADCNRSVFRSGCRAGAIALAAAALIAATAAPADAQSFGGFGGGGFGGGGFANGGYGGGFGRAPASGMGRETIGRPGHMGRYPSQRIGRHPGQYQHHHHPRRVIGPYGPPLLGIPLGVPPMLLEPEDDEPLPVVRPPLRRPAPVVAPQEIEDEGPPPPKRKAVKHRNETVPKAEQKPKKPRRTAGTQTSKPGCERKNCKPARERPPRRRPHDTDDSPVIIGTPLPVETVPPAGLAPEQALPANSVDALPQQAVGGGGGAGQNAAAAGGGSRLGGIPPAGERRFVPDEIVCVLRANITEPEIDRFLRSHRMTRTPGGRQQIALLSSRVFRYRITDRRAVPAVIADLQRDARVVSAQPNYLYTLAQAAAAPGAQSAAVSGGQPDLYSTQYTVGKLQLREAHAIAKGEQVLVAVIDSGIDAAHPELSGAVVKQIDVVGEKDRMPHAHGTAMAGAIVARSQLMGVAPAAKLLAIKAFAATNAAKGSGTTFNLIQAIDRAVEEKARVINLSFAGPADPVLQRSLQAARRRGIVLVASAGNAGPSSAPLYPAADPNVIAVTATDASDRLFRDANRGSYIAVAAPGVDILVAAPHAEYGLSTGTSVAAAHVSGIVALLLARKPQLDPDAIRAALRDSARPLPEAESGGAPGTGIANAYGAVVAVEGQPAPASGLVTQ